MKWNKCMFQKKCEKEWQCDTPRYKTTHSDVHLKLRGVWKEEVEPLLNNGHDIHETDHKFRNALFHACSKDVIDSMIEWSSNEQHNREQFVNHKDHIGQMPLLYHCRKDDLNDAEALLDHCECAIHARDDNYGGVFHHIAEYQGPISRKLLQKIIKSGIPLTQKDINEQTAFHLAARNGNFNLIELMFEYDKDGLTMKDKRGITALDLAADERVFNFCKLAIKHLMIKIHHQTVIYSNGE